MVDGTVTLVSRGSDQIVRPIKTARIDPAGGFELLLDPSQSSSSQADSAPDLFIVISAEDAKSSIVELQPNSKIEALDVTLEAVDQLAPQLEHPAFVDGSSWDVYGADLIQALPLAAARSIDSLALLGAGVFPAPESVGEVGPSVSPTLGTIGQFSMNGLRSRENNFTTDGSDDNDEEFGVRRSGYVARSSQSIESFREVEIITRLYDARFGRNIGGQVNALTSTGARRPFASVNFLGNTSAMTARPYFDSASTQSPAVFVDGSPAPISKPAKGARSEILSGLTVGGPFFATKAFFLGSFEIHSVDGKEQHHFAVPTAQQRGLSQLVGSGLYPASLAGDAIFSLFPFPNDSAGPYGANSYTQTIASRQTAALSAFRLDHHFKAWNADHVVTGRANGIIERGNLPTTGDALYSSLAEHTSSNSTALLWSTNHGSAIANTFRFSFGKTWMDFPELRDAGLLPSGQFPGTSFLLNRPLLLNVTANGSGMPRFISADPARNPDLSSILGQKQTGPLSTEVFTGPVGEVRVAGFSTLGVDSFHFPLRRANSAYQWADTFSHTSGRQTFTTGFELWYIRLDSTADRNSRPRMDFGGELIQSRPALDPFPQPPFLRQLLSPSGAVAMGRPSAIYQTFANAPYSSFQLHRKQIDVFFSHQIRIGRRLTVTSGVRLILNRLPESSDGRFENDFDPANFFSTAFPETKDQCSRFKAEYQNYCSDIVTYLASAFPPELHKVFGADPVRLDPRIGFAWDAMKNGKMIFRGGFGGYTGQFPAVILSESRDAFPRYLSLKYTGESDLKGLFYNLASPLVSGNPFQPGSLNLLRQDAAGDPLALLAFGFKLPGNVQLQPVQPETGLKNPRSLQFGLSLETNISKNLTVSTSYVGTLGRKLLRVVAPESSSLPLTINQVRGFNGTAFPVFSSNDPQYGTAVPLVPIPVQVARTLFTSSASSQYHSLQTVVRAKISGLLINSSFSYSHAIDDSSDFFDTAGTPALPQDATRPSERSSSSYDMKFRSVSYWSWDDVFRRKGSAKNSDLLGQWQLAGIVTAQSGQPFTVNTVYDVNQDGNFTDRLNSTSGIDYNTGDRRIPLRLIGDSSGLLAQSLFATDPSSQCGRFLNGTSYTFRPANLCDGSVGRNTFRAHGLFDVDLAATRTLRLSETARVLIRAEVFNVFNHPNFALPVRILESPSFGESTHVLTPSRTLRIGVRLIL